MQIEDVTLALQEGVPRFAQLVADVFVRLVSKEIFCGITINPVNLLLVSVCLVEQ